MDEIDTVPVICEPDSRDLLRRTDPEPTADPKPGVEAEEARQGSSLPMSSDKELERIRSRLESIKTQLFDQGKYNCCVKPSCDWGVLAPLGIDLPMAAGAVAMSLSTILVAVNAQLLRRLKLRADLPAVRTPAAVPA